MKIKMKITAIDKENSLQKQKGELYLGLKKINKQTKRKCRELLLNV